ncbi:LysR family transcriptional regulator [Janibacter indicus]
MDLIKHLRYFVTVAEEQHIGHAADELGMTQPPLSQGIQRLERRWGLRLFDRRARGVRLTESGTALLPQAQHVLDAADDLDREAADRAEDARPRRLGLTPDLGSLLVECASLAAEVLRPTGTAVSPVIAPTTALVDQLARGELDLAVLQHPAVVDGLDTGPVHTIPRLLAVSADHGGGGPTELGLPIAHTPRSDNPPAHDQLVDALRRAGCTGPLRGVATPAEALALTAAGLACSVHPASDLPTRLRSVSGPGVDLRVRVAAARLAPADPHRDLLAAALEARLATG